MMIAGIALQQKNKLYNNNNAYRHGELKTEWKTKYRQELQHVLELENYAGKRKNETWWIHWSLPGNQRTVSLSYHCI
jgi:hypothetical protein